MVNLIATVRRGRRRGLLGFARLRPAAVEENPVVRAAHDEFGWWRFGRREELRRRRVNEGRIAEGRADDLQRLERLHVSLVVRLRNVRVRDEAALDGIVFLRVFLTQVADLRLDVALLSAVPSGTETILARAVRAEHDYLDVLAHAAELAPTELGVKLCLQHFGAAAARALHARMNYRGHAARDGRFARAARNAVNENVGV